MAVTHLNDAELRELVIHCLAEKLFSISDVTDRGVKTRMFQYWRAGRDSPKSVLAARSQCNAFFGPDGHELPVRFQQAGGPADSSDSESESDTSTASEELSSESSSEELPVEEPKIVPKKKRAASPERAAPAAPAQTFKLCTWNLKNIGKATDDGRKQRIQLFLQDFDIIAVQEIRSESFKKHMVDAGNALMAGLTWIQTQKYGASKRTEALGFWYQSKRLNLEGMTTHVDCDTSYKPFCVTFTCVVTRVRFTLFNVHIAYGDKADLQARRDEINLVIDKLVQLVARPDVFGEVYLCGDFNLEPADVGFDRLRTQLHYRPVNDREPTNVGQERFIYDNIWVPAASTMIRTKFMAVESFNSMLHLTDKESLNEFRKAISDHLPLSVRLQIDLERAEAENE